MKRDANFVGGNSTRPRSLGAELLGGTKHLDHDSIPREVHGDDKNANGNVREDRRERTI